MICSVIIPTLCYFNSIKVRLELKIIIKVALYALFQFHKGAIRTIEFNTNFPGIFLFQFHKGAIRTQVGELLPVFTQISIP